MAPQDHCTDSPYINTFCVCSFTQHQPSAMDARENSKALQQLQSFDKQEQCASPYLLSYPSISLFTPNPHIHSNNLYPYPMFSTLEFNVPKTVAAVANTNSEGPPGEGEHSFENVSDSDSSSEVGGDAYDGEEVSLDELLLHDGKAKKKIEQMAAMVGVDTTEPVVVLAEVVRVLKHLKRINQYHTTT